MLILNINKKKEKTRTRLVIDANQLCGMWKRCVTFIHILPQGSFVKIFNLFKKSLLQII